MSKTAWSPFRQYANKSRNNGICWQNWLALGLLSLLAGWAFFRMSSLPQYDWNWSLLGEFILHKNQAGKFEAGLLLDGLLTTLRVGFWTIVFATFVGIACGMLMAVKTILIRLSCQLYVNICRATPPLVLLFCVYFFAGNILPSTLFSDFICEMPLPFRKITSNVFSSPQEMDRMLAAILALGIYHGAYVSEIIRGGIESVPRGQWDAALALGFSRLQCMRLVILPQGARLIIAPLTGQYITIFKDSALASLISLPDLTFESLEIMAVSQMTFEIWISSGLIYLLIGGFCSLFGHWLENRYSYGTK